MNNIDSLQEEIDSLFKGLDAQIEVLENRQEARSRILESLKGGRLQEALDLAEQAGLILLDDPAFSTPVLKYWLDAQKRFQEYHNNFIDTQKDIEEKEKQTKGDLEALISLAQHYQKINALASADYALRELDIESLERNLDSASLKNDRELPLFEQNWLEKMQADLEWLKGEKEKGLGNWERLESIKKRLRRGEPIPEQDIEILQEHPGSYLISLWKQQDALIRLRQGASNEYLFEREELNKIIARVNDIKAGLGEKPKKILPMDADRLWHLLLRLEEHLTGLPIAFFQCNVEVTQKIVGALEAIKGLKPHKMWPWASKKEWNRYLGDRIEFLQAFYISGKHSD